MKLLIKAVIVIAVLSLIASFLPEIMHIVSIGVAILIGLMVLGYLLRRRKARQNVQIYNIHHHH